MATSVIEHLRRAVLLRDGAGLGDGELLGCFIERHDEAALGALVKRHGPMVWGVCRRLLSHHDAEDAFQATFIVLVRKAASIVPRVMVGNWLYGVAHQTALLARRTAARRRAREVQVTEMPEPANSSQGTGVGSQMSAELRSVLDEELSRLPENYRAVVVLCDLEGRTRKEVARQLGVPEGTVAGRLPRARALLAKRLTQRGVALSGGALAAVLAQQAALASVPNSVVDSTITAASLLAAGKSAATGAISAKVAVLTEGVLKTMFVKKIGIVAGALIVLTLATAAVVGHFSAAHAAPTQVQPERGAQGPVGREEAPAVPVVLFPPPEKTSERAEAPEPLTLKGHTGEVLSVCFSPDGKRILTGGGVFPRGGLGGAGGNPSVPGSGEVKVWDAEKGTEILALKGHTDRVTSVCFSPDGKRLASAGADQTVRVWDAEKGQEIFILKEQTRSAGSVCFSPDGKRLASISSAHIKVWDAEKGQELLTLKAEVRPNGSVCFSPDGKRLASVYPWSSGGRLAPAEIKVWDAEKGQELLTLKGHPSFIFSVAFSPDGKRLASAGADQTVRVWDAENGQELLALKGHRENVGSVCFSPDGKLLASASWDRTVKVWDAEKGQELLTLKGHTGLLRSVCFSPDGKRLASASKDQTVKVWSLDQEQ